MDLRKSQTEINIKKMKTGKDILNHWLKLVEGGGSPINIEYGVDGKLDQLLEQYDEYNQNYSLTNDIFSYFHYSQPLRLLG